MAAGTFVATTDGCNKLSSYTAASPDGLLQSFRALALFHTVSAVSTGFGSVGRCLRNSIWWAENLRPGQLLA